MEFLLRGRGCSVWFICCHLANAHSIILPIQYEMGTLKHRAMCSTCPKITAMGPAPGGSLGTTPSQVIPAPTLLTTLPRSQERLLGGGDLSAEIISLGSNGFDEKPRDAYFEDERTGSGKAAEIRECIMFGLLREVQKSWRPATYLTMPSYLHVPGASSLGEWHSVLSKKAQHSYQS